jgi:hypothetical protein
MVYFSDQIARSFLFMKPGRSLLKFYLKDRLHNEIINKSDENLHHLISDSDINSTETFETFKFSTKIFVYNIDKDIYVSYLVWLYKKIFEIFPNEEIWKNQLDEWTIEEKQNFILKAISPIA